MTDDEYTRHVQCLLPILSRCRRTYRRLRGSNTFVWHVNGISKGDEDWEHFNCTCCACMSRAAGRNFFKVCWGHPPGVPRCC